MGFGWRGWDFLSGSASKGDWVLLRGKAWLQCLKYERKALRRASDALEATWQSKSTSSQYSISYDRREFFGMQSILARIWPNSIAYRRRTRHLKCIPSRDDRVRVRGEAQAARSPSLFWINVDLHAHVATAEVEYTGNQVDGTFRLIGSWKRQILHL